AAYELPDGGVRRNFPVAQLAPRGKPAEYVVEIQFAAQMEHAPNVWKSQRVEKPAAAVQYGHAAHPVGMLIDDEQVERLAQPPEQRERDMVKIAGAVERQNRLGGSWVQTFFQMALKAPVRAERTAYPDAWSPIPKRHDFRSVCIEQGVLCHNTAIEVKD